MGTFQQSRGTVRFDVFEVDLQAGELRKQGAKIKLQEQPFQILQMLLEHPGEVVTRDELQKRIWPTDTFVDFEQGLYNASSGCARRLAIRPKRQATSRPCRDAAIASAGLLQPAQAASNRLQFCRWKISPAILSKSTSPMDDRGANYESG